MTGVNNPTLAIRLVAVGGTGQGNVANWRIDNFSVTALNILPLTTRNFTAAPRNGKVQLDWTGVATHISAYFEVERSDKVNGNYSTIAKIPVSSVGEAAYRFMDNSPLEVDNYYRIRIVDENQKVTYTRILQVRLTGSHLALNNLFPTLVQGNLNLVVSNGNKGDAQIEVIDMAGRIVLKQSLSLNTGSQTIQLNVSRLTRGSYTVLLRKGDQTVQSRFIKQ
ncbi:T9SS type A sorting domain-containing protein [Flavihumibacter rivuli]|uniref:T9SS type A sorting domain-containing protein n=1 Tax=Flavihumibacter rivuli TaxID=2838156 RepID=UPI001BDDFF0B|nr:T9SS type A sorting domain-containing protein [Flavihumibacter rivuli]ULQ56618.1 T9SS type A sorting domain-containing protein [Flavihumibacter rivuli]